MSPAATARHARPDPRRPGDGLVRAGVLVFAVGLVAAIAAVVPSVVSGHPAPETLILLAGGLLPLGLGIALGGLVRAARTASRTARGSASRSGTGSPPPS